MTYIGTQPNNVKQNTGLYTPNDITALTKDGNWGGSMEHIQTQSISGSANASFTSIKESKYDVHLLHIYNFVSTSSDYLNLRFYESGVIETASVYQKALQYGYVTGSFGENKSTSETSLFTGIENATGTSVGNGYIYVYNAGNSSKYTLINVQATNYAYMDFGGGIMTQASTVNGFYFYGNGGYNFDAEMTLYGIKQI